MNDFELLLRAAAFAAHKHRDQRRKDAKATPYINHPIDVARTLCVEGGVEDVEILAAGLLHDTVEDTKTSRDELRIEFGLRIAGLVDEVTDDKCLPPEVRKQLQVEKAAHLSSAAQQIKIADKLCNLRDILANPPAKWSGKRKKEYFDWAKSVVNQIRGSNPRLAARFDEAYSAID